MGEWEEPTPLFEPAGPHSVKVQCRVCGAKGYGPIDPTSATFFPWQRHCMKGHPRLCLCGRRFTTRGFGPHLGSNLRHGNPGHGIAS